MLNLLRSAYLNPTAPLALTPFAARSEYVAKEPDSGNLHVRICGGGRCHENQWNVLHGHEGGNAGHSQGRACRPCVSALSQSPPRGGHDHFEAAAAAARLRGLKRLLVYLCTTRREELGCRRNCSARSVDDLRPARIAR